MLRTLGLSAIPLSSLLVPTKFTKRLEGGGALNVAVIVVRNGISQPSTNPGRNYWRFT